MFDVRGVTILIALVIAGPALAVTIPDGGWVVVRVDAAGASTLRVDSVFKDARDFNVDASILYDAQKRLVWHAVYSRDGEFVTVDAQLDRSSVLHAQPSHHFSGSTFFSTTTVSCSPCGTYYLVVFGAGDISSWSWEASATGGATLTTDSGSEAFAFRSRDFESVAAVAATPGRSVVVEGSKVVSSADSLIAVFEGNAPQMRMDGAPCPCSRLNLDVPAGDHAFELVGTNAPADVLLYGASVRFP